MGALTCLESALVEGVMAIGRRLADESFDYGQAELKDLNDPVTEKDRATETSLRMLMQDIVIADFSVIGEEQGSDSTIPDARYRGHIDPIDGTKSFCFQDFDSSIGLGVEDMQYPGTGVIGIVYDFMRDIMYVGSHCNGLKKIHRGKPVRNVDRQNLPQKPRILIEGTNEEVASLYQHLKENGCSPYINSGSMLLSMAQTAFMTYDGFVSFPRERSRGKSWDVAGGSVMLYQRERLGDDGFTFRRFRDDKTYDLNHPEDGFMALPPGLKKQVRKYLCLN
jgi:fructose-1,6-bisphosphatase/inositol monophosphatase family enzyme